MYDIVLLGVSWRTFALKLSKNVLIFAVQNVRLFQTLKILLFCVLSCR